MKQEATQRRPYRMSARAEAAAETGRRILESMAALHTERFHSEITLEDVAGRAGVTVQTVLRRFGSKDQLLTATAEWVNERVVAQRGEAPVGDVAGAVANLLTHYDETGEGVLRLLAQEEMVPQFGPLLERGRELHYQWVEKVFSPFLASARDADQLRAQLIVLADVYVWKLLALDLGFSRDQVEETMAEMFNAVIGKETK